MHACLPAPDLQLGVICRDLAVAIAEFQLVPGSLSLQQQRGGQVAGRGALLGGVGTLVPGSLSLQQ